MTITALPTEFLTSRGTWSHESAQTSMEVGSEIHRVTLGVDSIISKRTFQWTAEPSYIGDLYALFCTTDQLIGIYTFTDEVMGAVNVQPEGNFTWTTDSMSRWVATLTVRRV